MRDKSYDMAANLVRHIRWIYVYLKMSILVKTFSHKSLEYQHDLNKEEEKFSPKNERWG